VPLLLKGKLNPRDEPQLSLLGGRWSSNTLSASSNFVLIFAGQPDPSLVVAHERILTGPFGIGAELVPKAGFSCLRIFGVPVLENAYDPSDLQDEIMRNPECKGLSFIQPPRWFFKDHHGRSHDSILVTIFDPSNKFTPALLRRPLWMFGVQCKARRFDSRPVLRQCDKCHKLGHSVDRCTRRDPLFVRCERCGGGHATENHEVRCPNRAIHKTTGACDCPPICGNCKDAKKKTFKGHSSFDVLCPLRKLYRDPNFHSEYPQDQDPFVWTEEPPFDEDVPPRIAPPLPSPSSPTMPLPPVEPRTSHRSHRRGRHRCLMASAPQPFTVISVNVRRSNEHTHALLHLSTADISYYYKSPGSAPSAPPAPTSTLTGTLLKASSSLPRFGIHTHPNTTPPPKSLKSPPTPVSLTGGSASS
jgi:hypothetical protein